MAGTSMRNHGLENSRFDRKLPVSKLTESFGEHPVLPSCCFTFTSRFRDHICPDRAVIFEMRVQINAQRLRVVDPFVAQMGTK